VRPAPEKAPDRHQAGALDRPVAVRDRLAGKPETTENGTTL
jgi:hypothetical protein